MDMDGLMIFVVDDDRDVGEVSASLLSAFGWKTRTFRDARDCLAAALDQPPACILSDLDMPFMDGIRLMEALSAAGIKVPVVVMTGLSRHSPGWAQAADLASGMVAKPYGEADLYRSISRAVGASPDPGVVR